MVTGPTDAPRVKKKNSLEIALKAAKSGTSTTIRFMVIVVVTKLPVAGLIWLAVHLALAPGGGVAELAQWLAALPK